MTARVYAWRVESVDGRVWWGTVVTKVKDPPNKSGNRAKEGVATAGMANLFTTNGVFLSGEDKEHEGSGGEGGVRQGGGVEAGVANVELDVREAEWVRSVIARVHQKKEADDHHVAACGDKWGPFWCGWWPPHFGGGPKEWA